MHTVRQPNRELEARSKTLFIGVGLAVNAQQLSPDNHRRRIVQRRPRPLEETDYERGFKSTGHFE